MKPQHNEYNGRPIIYNIGYQRLKPEGLVAQIRAYDITALVDVRSIPYSRINKQFNKNRLPTLIAPCRYLWRGKTLGGKDLDESTWLPGLIEIARLAGTENILLMCMEADWEKCHRMELARILASEYRIHNINLP